MKFTSSCFSLKQWESRVEEDCSGGVFSLSGLQSSSVSRGMDTIWDFNINSSKMTSSTVPQSLWRHWQKHESRSEITLSWQFPSALAQHLLERTQTFLWFTAVCVRREAVQGQTSTLTTEYKTWESRSELSIQRDYWHSLYEQLPQICPYGHQLSSACLQELFCRLLPLRDQRPKSPTASGSFLKWTPLLCPSFQTNSGLMVSPELQPRAGVSPVLSTHFHQRRCSDVSQSTWKTGEAGRGNMANLLILPAPFFLSH